jgi:hypothetical protein
VGRSFAAKARDVASEPSSWRKGETNNLCYKRDSVGPGNHKIARIAPKRPLSLFVEDRMDRPFRSTLAPLKHDAGFLVVGLEKPGAPCIISIGSGLHYEQTPMRRCLLLI